MNLADMTARGLRGQSITREEALEILHSDDSELMGILAAAGQVRRHFFANRVRLNYLVNLKSGLCPEDCSYCSQRLSSQANIMKYSWADPQTVHDAVEAGIAGGARRVCMVASGHGPSNRDVDRVNGMVRDLKADHPDVALLFPENTPPHKDPLEGEEIYVKFSLSPLGLEFPLRFFRSCSLPIDALLL